MRYFISTASFLIMSNHVVRRHTLAELLILLGKRSQPEGIHIVDRSVRANAGPPINYPFRSDHFSLLIVTKGTLQLRINLSDYEVTENQLLLITPTVVREYGLMSEDSMFCGMVFTSEFMGQAGMSPKHLELFDFFSANNNPVLTLAPQDVETLLSLLKIMGNKNVVTEQGVLDKEVINHSFLAFIYEMAAVYRRNRGMVSIQLTKKEDLAMRFMKLLNEHFREERSVFYYADLLCITPKYLSQTVKEVTGRTAGEMIDGMVVMEAKVLLNDMSHSVAHVAESLYFSDQFFFSKFFKKHTGLTPTDYRKIV